MSKVTESQPTPPAAPSLIENRKTEHIRINLERDVQFPNLTTGLERYRFLHRAVPELNLSEIDTTVTLFGRTLRSPILISSMTGGTGLAHMLNQRLAEVAQANGIAMGLGSQRAGIQQPELAYTYQVRAVAPDVLLFANIGAVQLNYTYGIDECRRAVDMIEADALILHFNVLQEAVQPEGDTNFAGLIDRVAEVCRHIGVPVIAKEVGWGFSTADVRLLVEAGVAAIDVAGSGGTSWSEVEYHRAPTSFHARVARAFADWGIPTADAIRYAVEHGGGRPVIASGGLKDGIDIAKSVALGASLGGIAGGFLRAADDSTNAADQFARELAAQIRIAMLCAGAPSIAALQQTPLVTVPS